MNKGEFLCRREEEVRVREVRAAEAVRRVAGAVRRVAGAVRLTAVLIEVRTAAVGAGRRFFPEGSGGTSLRGFRRI